MINFGNYNNLKVMREKEYGFFLDGQTGNTSDDILLPSKNIVQKEKIKIGDEVNVFVYRDSQKRLVATQKTPKACAGDIAVLKVDLLQVLILKTVCLLILAYNLATSVMDMS